jgi:hypothetical protein
MRKLLEVMEMVTILIVAWANECTAKSLTMYFLVRFSFKMNDTSNLQELICFYLFILIFFTF